MLFVKTVKKSTTQKGTGIFLDEDVQKGQKILSFTGNIIDWPEVERLGYEDHAVPVGINKYVAIHNPLPESYVNHSCEPSAGFSDEATLIALKDLKAGEEITFDYSLVTVDGWTMQCHCGAKTCRKVVGDYMDLPDAVKETYKDITPKWVLEFASSHQ